MKELNALHEWKAGGRGETMMSTFEYKSSHDKMFIEGFRMAEKYFEKEIDELKKLNKWHDVKIELPKENREYLVSYDENCKHSFYVLHYDASNWYEEGSNLSASKPYWWKEIE